ncbi:odorant receptor 4-like [Halyomorpha halys]|uniref:odorant receptor 4-like n=1 Tax=Halyomorpha halys TaxID=286706 RepID=UPI0006D4F6BE|nr:Odorant receptor 76 [Halyomorpha halys]
MVKYIRSLLGDLPTVLDKTFLISIDSDKRFKQIFFTICNAIMTTACVGSMYFLGLEKSLEGAAIFSALSTTISVKQLIYFFRLAQVKKLLYTLKKLQNHHRETWEIEMFEAGSVDTWNAVHTFCLTLLCYLMLFLVLSAVLDFTIGIIFPRAPSLLVQLPGQGFIDFFEPRTLEWLLVTTLFLMWAFEAMVIHIGTESLTFVPIMYVKIELKILRHKLLLFKEELEKLGKNTRHADKLLTDIILHHQRTIEVLNVMKKTLGLPLAVQNTAFSITLCFNFYCIITFNEGGSLAVKFNGVLVVICIGLLLFGLCFFGESLEKENHEVLNCIYDLAWYLQDKNFRRSVLTMLRQAQRPYVINYRRIANLNLTAFMQIINTSYSYLMMLKSTV